MEFVILFHSTSYNIYLARTISTDGLRPAFFAINGIVYAIQIVLWLIIWWKPIIVLVILSKVFFAGVFLFAALGFFLYGGRNQHLVTVDCQFMNVCIWKMSRSYQHKQYGCSRMELWSRDPKQWRCQLKHSCLCLQYSAVDCTSFCDHVVFL